MNLTAESISLSLANFRTQMLTALTDSAANDGASFGGIMSQLQAGGDGSSAANSLSMLGAGNTPASGGLPGSSGGPASGYAMMTRINGLDVLYKAQYSELNEMENTLPQLQAAAQHLGAVDGATANDGIAAQLQSFVREYNAWVQRFKPDVQKGGVLAGTQAAELSLYELNQSVTDPFIGAKDGLHGLASIGISIDPTSKLMSVDATQLDAALANNKPGVVAAVDAFSANFAEAARLLADNGNIVRNRLDNLNGAITYIDGNAQAWQSEFGSGDPPNPTGQVAQALAAYRSTSSI